MTPLLTASFIYIMLIIFLYSFKPKICFCNDGKMKKFGLGKNKTPFTFVTISIILGIFSLVLTSIYNQYASPIADNVVDTALTAADEALKLLQQG